MENQSHGWKQKYPSYTSARISRTKPSFIDAVPIFSQRTKPPIFSVWGFNPAMRLIFHRLVQRPTFGGAMVCRHAKAPDGSMSKTLNGPGLMSSLDE